MAARARLLAGCVLMLAWLGLCCSAPAAGNSPVRLIVDTDMSTDCDDVGALCEAHALMSNGEAELIAVVHNTGLNTGVGAISTINHYYGRDEIPIGAYKGPFAASERGVYVDDLVKRFPSPIKNYSQVPDAVVVYRKALAASPDSSVWIASIGFTTNMEALLKSAPDSISPLSGHDLVSQKVAGVAWMGGQYPTSGPGHTEWNFGHDGIASSTSFCVDQWPNASVRLFSGWEIGSRIMTGGSMTNSTPASNPCRQAYIDHQGPGKDRQSWDPSTVLLAVRGVAPFWTAVSTGHNVVNSTTGENHWAAGPSDNQGYLVEKEDPAAVAAVIEKLLVQAPPAATKASAVSFVVRNGTQLALDGKPWRFSGCNIYWLGLDENVQCAAPLPTICYPTDFRIQDALATAKAMGANVVRGHTLGVSTGNAKSFEPSLGVFGTKAFERISYAVSQAQAYGLRLIIPLTDNWEYYHGGKHNFVDWLNITGPNATACVKPQSTDPKLGGKCAFYHDPRAIAAFKVFVRRLLTTPNVYTNVALKDDPTVLAFETGNELAWPPSAWTAEIAAFLKLELGVKQLVVDGRNMRHSGADPDWAHSPHVDIASGHYYPMLPDLLLANAATANQAGKVFLNGEYGWESAGLEGYLETVLNSSVAGALFWSLFPHADGSGYVGHDDEHSVHFPGDTVDMRQRVQLLTAHAYAIRGLPEPAPMVPPAPRITNASAGGACLTWRGAAAALNYTVQRAHSNASSAADWATVCDQCATDYDTPWFDASRNATETAFYRVRGHSLAGAPGPWSPVARLGPGPAACHAACAFKPDTDYPEGFATSFSGSRESCCAQCAANSRCVAGVFSGGRCFLKSSLANPRSKPGVVACIKPGAAGAA